MNAVELRIPGPAESFPAWLPAQRLARSHAMDTLPSIAALRSDGFLPKTRAERIANWYAGPRVESAREIERTYQALAYEVTGLARSVTAPRAEGGFGVLVRLVQMAGEPYAGSAALCRDLSQRGAITLRAASVDPPHPVLCDQTLDRLHMVHDVFGHAALGLGFDLQSEYAAWLYCRPLFSRAARPAAFCKLVGAVTSYVLTGTKQLPRADLPPAGLLTANDRL
jgi:hypothetical protein